MLDGVKKYTIGAAAVMAVAVPVFFIAMPWLVEVVFGDEYTGAVDGRANRPARGGDPVRDRLDEVVAGHHRPPATPDRHARDRGNRGRSRSSIVLGNEWGATGAAVAVLASTVVFAVTWAIALARIRSDVGTDPTRLAGDVAS